MKMTKPGIKKSEKIWTGSCRQCKAEFIATEDELTITYCQRDGNFAHHDCDYCSAKAGNAVIFYPKT